MAGGRGMGWGRVLRQPALPSAAVQLSKGMFEQDNMPPTAQIKCYREQVGRSEGKRSPKQQSDQGSDSVIWFMFPLPGLPAAGGGHRMSAKWMPSRALLPPSPAAPAGAASGFIPSVCAVGLASDLIASALTASALIPQPLLPQPLPPPPLPVSAARARSVLTAQKRAPPSPHPQPLAPSALSPPLSPPHPSPLHPGSPPLAPEP